MEVGLGPGDILLEGDPASPKERGTAVHHSSVNVYCGKRSPISATAELLLYNKSDRTYKTYLTAVIKLHLCLYSVERCELFWRKPFILNGYIEYGELKSGL